MEIFGNILSVLGRGTRIVRSGTAFFVLKYLIIYPFVEKMFSVSAKRCIFAASKG